MTDLLLGYIGPGPGFAFMGAFLALLAAIGSGLLSLVSFPVRILWRTVRGRQAYKHAKVKKVIFLGLDGLDPKLAEKLMEAGKLPHLSRLAERGGYSRLGTTFPCLSPVAWSCFATGVNPGKHRIFDFLNRNLKTYAPELSSSKVHAPDRVLKLGKHQIPLGRPHVEMLRKSVPFWSVLGEHGVRSTVLRVPITFPATKFNGLMLSAMCTPDLRGTQGSFSFYSTELTEPELTEGHRLPLKLRKDGVLSGWLDGPPDPEDASTWLRVPFQIHPRHNGTKAWELHVGDAKTPLVPGEYTDWISVEFKKGLFKARGILRFRLNRTDPFELYTTPIQIDPARPGLPISHPSYYAIYLSKLLGSFSTLGLAEDTWALNERVIDEEAFLEQAWSIHEEREKMFFNALDKTHRGVIACVFDASDRIQHMFYRFTEPDHPANAGFDVEKYQNVLEQMYVRMDELVGRTLDYVDDDTLLFVLSDHGFSSFQRGVNLNVWLKDNGYLVLKEGASTGGNFFENVDWSRTQAYAVGLGGLYVNLKGREAGGCVNKGEEHAALKAEIAEKLSGLRDPERDEVAIRSAAPADQVYQGPYLGSGPDVLVGYNAGYRASWGTALGAVEGGVFEDNTKAWGGDHCIDPELVPGVLFSNRAFQKKDPKLEDFAPTMLDLFGIDRPRYMDGAALFEEGGSPG